tara:strand:+ start:665 stop:856 length:192 start_codon:yes stop_codon:yes gene_type:complete
MTDLYIHEKLLSILHERQDQISEQILEGQVEDITAFKELRARLAELAYIQQELELLLKRMQHE